MPKIPRHQMYLRRIAVISPDGLSEVAGALARAGIAAHLNRVTQTLACDVDLIEVAVTGRDEEAARAALALALTHVDSLKIDAPHDDVHDGWDA